MIVEKTKNLRGSFTAALFLFVLNLSFLRQPLLKIISYESSAVNAIFFFFIAAYLFQSSGSSFLIYLKNLSLLVLIPIIILSVGTLFLTDCRPTDGIAFYPLIVIPAVITGMSVGKLKNDFSNKALRTLLPIAVFIFFIADSAYELYFYPQMYFYHPIIGFFPGTVYDELILIDSKFLLNGTFVLGISLFILFYLRKIKSKSAKISFFVLLWTFFFLLKPFFGLATDFKHLEEELRGKLKTLHATIIYDSSITDSNIEYIGDLHDFYIEELSKTLKLDSIPHITSIIYQDREQKRKLFGAPNADLAKPWLKQIYISVGSVNSTLKHEISHILLGEYSDNFLNLGANMNPLIVEGFASALTDNYDGYSVDFGAKLAYDNGFKFNDENISGFKFFSVNPMVAYSYAGSFIKFIIENEPTPYIYKFYAGKTDKKPEEKMIKYAPAYKDYIASLPDLKNKRIAEYYFGSAPLYKRKCLRSTALKLYYAGAKLKRNEFNEAFLLYESAFEESRRFNAFKGMVYCLSKLQLKEKVDSLINEKIELFMNTRWEIPALYYAAVFYIGRENFEYAAKYSKLLQNDDLPDVYRFASKIVEFAVDNRVNIYDKKSEKVKKLFLKQIKIRKNAAFILSAVNFNIFEPLIIRDFIGNFTGSIKNYNNVSQYLLVELSEKAIELKMLQEAEKLLIYAKKMNTNYYRKNVISEKLRKIEWLKKRK